MVLRQEMSEENKYFRLFYPGLQSTDSTSHWCRLEFNPEDEGDAIQASQGIQQGEPGLKQWAMWRIPSTVCLEYIPRAELNLALSPI